MGTPSNVSTAAINTCVGRRQYLVTYSQADESKFSTREIFGKMLEAEFNAGTRAAKVDYWVCSRRIEADRLQKMAVSQKQDCKKDGI